MSDDATPPARDFAALAAEIGALNSHIGPRSIPARTVPVPATASSPLKASIAAPYRVPDWNAAPATPGEWRDLVAMLARKNAARLPALRAKLGVTTTPTTLGGVPAFLVEPAAIPNSHRDQVILAIHGGGFVYNPGEAGTIEAVMMAGFGGYRVVSVDYRMPPDHPFPAANEDVLAAYVALLRDVPSERIGVVGTSAGGGLALALCLDLKAAGLPLPGAIAPGTPEADMTDSGDTLKTNEWLDNVLVSMDGYVSRARDIYLPAGHDRRDPRVSPLFGDFTGLPPAIITSGTRDLFLSNAVRVHRKLRQAGVEAALQVFEGMSHAQYLFNVDAPETREAFEEIARFFDTHLAP